MIFTENRYEELFQRNYPTKPSKGIHARHKRLFGLAKSVIKTEGCYEEGGGSNGRGVVWR
nr:MAG TPA: hypothetical protein [Caudoviricetes sp.]